VNLEPILRAAADLGYTEGSVMDMTPEELLAVLAEHLELAEIGRTWSAVARILGEGGERR